MQQKINYLPLVLSVIVAFIFVRRPDAETEMDRLRQEQNDIYKAAAAQAVQNMLDSAAKAKGYDSILSACSYAAYPNQFQAEGQEFVAWRGAVWAKCYEILAEVEAGTRPAPAVPELLAEIAATRAVANY